MPKGTGLTLKKISEEHRQYLLDHALRSELQRLRHKEWKRRRNLARLGMQMEDVAPVTAPAFGPTHVKVVSPKVLDFNTAYVRTIRLLDRIRRGVLHRGQNLFVDLQQCESLTPEVALVLAAELQRCRDLRPGSINGRDPRDPTTSYLLHELGFRRLLGFRPREFPTTNERTRRTYIQMHSGREGDSSLFSRLTELVLGEYATVTDQALTSDLAIGLNEAMLNAVTHAYIDPKKLIFPASPDHRWWMAGYRDAGRREILFIFYDQGLTIPGTLDRKFPELCAEVAAGLKMLLGRPDDGKLEEQLLKAAMEIGRTSTRKRGRGYGLNDIRTLIETSQGGSLTILSGRGRYDYIYGEHERTETLPISFTGTLIVWRLVGSEKVRWSDGNDGRDLDS